MSHIGIIVPTLYNKEQGYEFLASIETKKHTWQPCIIPNWKLNLSIAESWNKGINDLPLCDYHLVCNDDIVFSPTTLDNLIDAFQFVDENVIMITPGNARVQGATHEVSTWPINNDVNKVSFIEAPDFSCFLVRSNFFDLVGRFDTNFRVGYFEDNDMHRRINLAGFKAGYIPEISFYHYGSQTQNYFLDAPVCSSVQFEANREYYIQKWGGVPGKEIFDRPYGNGGLSIKDWQNNPYTS